MLIETWLAYALAATVIIIIPGPTVLLVISQSVRYGYKAALPLVVGVMLGDLTAMVFSMLGLGILLKTSATLFLAIKIIGAVYLVYLGIMMWRSPPVSQGDFTSVEMPWKKHLANAFFVTVLNPKGIVFFLAFIPQFINTSFNVLPQLVIFGITFLIIATLSAAVYAVFAARLGALLNGESAQRWFQRAGGGVLVSAGIITASMRQA